MQTSPVFPFGEWLPDRPAAGNTGATVARNVVPSESAYRPWRGHASDGKSVTGTLSLSRVNVAGGASQFIVGTATGLYLGSGSTFALQTGGFNATTWAFAQWGDEIIAVNADGLWYAPVTGGSFTKQENAPGALYVEVVGDFIVLGHITGHPNRIQWSGFNRRDIWGVDRANQADFQDMPYRYGAVTGLAGEQYNTVFQERAVSRLTFVGGLTVFRIDTFEKNKGCVSPGSILETSFLTLFVAQDGPNVWDGQTASPISDGKYRRWFRDEADLSNIEGAIDFRHGAAIWFWPKGTGSQGIIYVWSEQRAAEITSDLQISTMDYDDAGPVAFTSAGFGHFDGDALEALIETGEFEPAPNRRAFVSKLWPVVDVGDRTITAALGKRNQREGDTLVWTADTKQQVTTGSVSVRSSSRLHRSRVTIPSGTLWSHAQGVQVEFRPEGRQ